MIHNDVELAATQERIAWFQDLLAQFRVTTRPEEFPSMSAAYVAEVERMHWEVMQYLTCHASRAVLVPAPNSGASPLRLPVDEAAFPAPT